MLELLGSFLAYVLAFAIGSLIALLVSKRLYPATSEREALTQLDAVPAGAVAVGAAAVGVGRAWADEAGAVPYGPNDPEPAGPAPIYPDALAQDPNGDPR